MSFGQVQVPTLDKPVWAHLAQPYATKSAGAYLYPQIDSDKVDA